jgi:hypothetical protein
VGTRSRFDILSQFGTELATLGVLVRRDTASHAIFYGVTLASRYVVLGQPKNSDSEALHTNLGRVNRRRKPFLCFTIGLWLAAVAGAFGTLSRYSFSPGAPGNPPVKWPMASRIPLNRQHIALIMLVHPQCPCSRASIGELADLMAKSEGRISAYVLFIRLPGFADSWVHTDLWENARQIPGVTVISDNGREAHLFGAATSGQTLVYDRRGRLQFSGGITLARGHWGDNAGVNAVVALLGTRSQSGTATSAVYGCPLFAPGSKHMKPGVKCIK